MRFEEFLNEKIEFDPKAVEAGEEFVETAKQYLGGKFDMGRPDNVSMSKLATGDFKAIFEVKGRKPPKFFDKIAKIVEKEGYEIISQNNMQKQIAFKSRDSKWKFVFKEAYKGFLVVPA